MSKALDLTPNKRNKKEKVKEKKYLLEFDLQHKVVWKGQKL
jgi:hypothetical protein